VTDDIRIGRLAGLTVAEAARADDGLILGRADAESSGDTDEDERANRSLAAFALGDDSDQQEADR
jgi:hypothetical protein